MDCSTESVMTLVPAASTLSARVVVDPAKVCEQVVRQIAGCLSTGGVVALPTDTLYGLASNLTSSHRLFQIKSRDPVKPVAICVADVQDVYRYAEVTVPMGLLDSLLPGPFTLVFRRSANLPMSVNPDASLVGVRIPDHDLSRAVCRHLAQPIALTSANRSSQPSAISTHEFTELWPLVDLVVDEGTLNSDRSGSTVLDLSDEGVYRVIRRGCADWKEVSRLLDLYNIKHDESEGRNQ